MIDPPLTAEQVLARSIRYQRERLRLTAKQLADRITEVGGKVSRQAISKIELGERDVRIDELMQIARALRTSPLLLLFPVGIETERIPAEVQLADQTLPMWEAIRWFSGESYPPEDVDSHWGIPLYLARAHHKLRSERLEFMVDLTFGPQDEESKALASEEMRQRWYKLKDVRADMRRHGLTPPPAVDDLDGIDDEPRLYLTGDQVDALTAQGKQVRMVDQSKQYGLGRAVRPGEGMTQQQAIERGRKLLAQANQPDADREEAGQ